VTVQLYFGPYNDSHNPPYWCSPHGVELNNTAISVSTAMVGTKRVATVRQLALRNEGDEPVYNAADVTLCGLAFGTALPPNPDVTVQSALDLTGIGAQTSPPAANITVKHWAIQWTNMSVSSYSPFLDQPALMLGNGQVINWEMPRGITYFVLAAIVQCTSHGLVPRPPPTTDPCTAVWFGHF
jgi:hypothetical protein